MTDPITVPFGADPSEFNAALKAMETTAAESFTKIVEAASKGDFTGLATQLGGPVAGSFAEATKAALEFVKGQAEAAERLDDLAKAAGTTYAAMQGLEGAFAAGGVGAAGFERSMAHLAQTVNQAWTEIQRNGRTAGTQEESAQLGMQRAAMASEEAYRNLSKTMADVSAQARHDSQSIVDAQLSLRRAQLNQAKGNGEDVGDAEKALQQRENANSVVKAEQAIQDARRKSAEDAAGAADQIREAELKVEEAHIRVAEAAEKAHEIELKDVDKIGSEIERVATSTGKWSDSNLLLETSANTARDAIIKLASNGTGIKPTDEQVLMKTAEIFKGLGNDAESSAAKVEIVQRLMGAGFRSMGASAQQLVSILSQGPEALKKWEGEMTAFNSSNIGVKDSDVKALQDFTAAWATLSTYIQSAAEHLAGMSAGGFTSMFTAAKESITSTDGILHKFIESAGSVVEIISSIGSTIASIFHVIQPVVAGLMEAFSGVLKVISGVAQAIEQLVSSFTSLADKSDLIHIIEVAMVALAIAITDVGKASLIALAQFERLLLIVGLISKATAELVQIFAATAKAFGAGDWADKLGDIANKVEQGANAILRGATMGASDKIGLSDKTQGGSQFGNMRDPNAEPIKIDNKVEVSLKRDGGASATGSSSSAGAGLGGTAATPGTTAALPGYTEAEREAINKRIQEAPASATGIEGNLDRQYNPEKAAPGTFGSDGREWNEKYPAGPPTPPTESEKRADLKSRYDYTGEGSPDEWMKGRHLEGTQSYTGPQAKDSAEIASLKAEIEKLQSTPGGANAATAGRLYDKQHQLADLQRGDYVPGSGTPVQYSAGIQSQQKKYDDWVKSHPEANPNDQSTWGNNAASSTNQQQQPIDTSKVNTAAEDLASKIHIVANDPSWDDFKSNLSNLVSVIKEAITGIGQAKPSATPAAPASEGGGSSGGNNTSSGMAGGGRVRGPGGPRDDRAGLFWLSNGEHVMQAAAVDHYGQGFMDMVNSMMFPGMAGGGPVAPRPALVTTGATSTVNLSIDGNKFHGLKASENVARSLKQYAITRQSASAGKAPSWMQ